MKDHTPDLGKKIGNGHSPLASLLPEAPPGRKGFISAPSSVDTSTIRRELEKKGIMPFELDELDPGGRTITELLEDSLKQAEIVVAVLAGTESDSNVAFELGYATALKKRVLVFIPPNREKPVPFDLMGVPYFRIYPDNQEAIEFWLDQILKAPRERGPKPRDPIKKTNSIGPLADELLGRVRDAGERLSEREFEEIVRRAIEAGGTDHIYESPDFGTSPQRADLAIWSNDFEPWLGNPLLVEVKGHLRSQSELLEATQQLASVLERTRDGWGLLIFQGNGVNASDLDLANSRVLALSIEGLLGHLRDSSLGGLLRKLRNSRVHGKG